MKRFSVVTLGCKVNQYESEAIAEAFAAAGYTRAAPGEPAGVCVVNTCAVTAESERKSAQAIRRCVREHPDAKIAVAGCFSQLAADRVRAIPGVSLVVGSARKTEIVKLLEALPESRLEPEALPAEYEETPVRAYSGRTRAFLKIEDGCDQHCAYCVIPRARGPVRSRKLPDLLEEAARFAAQGFREIVVTGINLMAYGTDGGGASRLPEALRGVAAIEGIRRIRLSSMEPQCLTPELLAALTEVPKLCAHFHLSLQSGSDGVLRRMNRRYTAAEYRRIVQAAREGFPNAAITTDIIAGFPGETEAEFGETLAFIKEIAFAGAHVFPFSARAGTPAQGFPGQLTQAVKAERAALLRRAAGETRRIFLDAQVGLRHTVLAEGRPRGGLSRGKTGNGLPAVLSGALPAGELAEVNITAVRDGNLLAERLA